MRRESEVYPDLSAFIEAIDKKGISAALLSKLLERCRPCLDHVKDLHDRYEIRENAVPIYGRTPRFKDAGEAINNKVGNDFFGEIVDIKTGYFAGKPVTYSYSRTDESREDTGGGEAVETAAKALSDFVTRNNLYDVDQEVTKLAAIGGYAGRLFYVDTEGRERVMALPGYQTVILSRTEMTEPRYGVRVVKSVDIDNNPRYTAEFYDERQITFFKGRDLAALAQDGPPKPHLFEGCPLQGIPNNAELMGDAERVLDEIDAYDRTLSDANNDTEAFANAYMVFENLVMDDDGMRAASASGVISFQQTSQDFPAKVHYLEKDINDAFLEHHLDRLEGNIYRFSKTPNLTDESFGTASGVALKFKITGLETKCGMFQAKLQSAGIYMFKLLATSWAKKSIPVDPLQCFMSFKRNFPLDLVSEAQAAATLIGAGLPKEVAFSQLSFIDDVDYVMDLIDQELDGVPPLDDRDDEPPDDGPPEV